MEGLSITVDTPVGDSKLSSQYYEYDTRIDEHNWYLIFFGTMLFYFAIQALARVFAPPPGDIKVFIEKKRLKDYHFYYFQYPIMVHALVGVFGDPLILYFGGFRYNQPNHILHMHLMVHSAAYFAYDTIIEIYYKTDDMLTNFHHFFVLFGSYFHVRNQYSGYEYILMHWVAELSNPFLILRTMLKIMNKKDTVLYAASEVLFAGVFILMRLIVTPWLLIAIYEAENCIYSTKFCISFV